MNQWTKWFILVLLFIVNPVKAADKIIRVCWESELKSPYLQLEQKKITGIAVNLIDAILARQQMKAEHILLPWKRCLLGLRNGTIDLVPNASFKQERIKYGIYTEPLYATHIVLFYDRKKFPAPPVIQNIDDMKHYKVGGVLGYNYDQYKNQLNLELGSPNRITLMRRLQLGRIELAIEQQEVISTLAKAGLVNLTDIDYVPDPALPQEVYRLIVRKSYPGAEQLVDLLNKGMETLKQNGTEKQIFDRYMKE